MSKANYAPDGASWQACEQCLQSAEMFATLLHMDNLYENTNTGAIVCEKHLGYEASARFAAKPNAKSVTTSFGKIAKMSDAEATEWIAYVAHRYPNGCESCR